MQKTARRSSFTRGIAQRHKCFPQTLPRRSTLCSQRFRTAPSAAAFETAMPCQAIGVVSPSLVRAAGWVPQSNRGKVQEQEDKGDCDTFDEAEPEWASQYKERHKRFG